MNRETAIARAEAYFYEGRFQADLATLAAFDELERYLTEALRPRLEAMAPDLAPVSPDTQG